MNHERYREAAEAALTHWDVEVAATEFINAAENITFRVESGTGDVFVLRLHRPGYHNLAELDSEQQWTRALREAGIDVPVPVMTRDGAGYVPVDAGAERRYAGMLEWVEGVPLDEVIRDRKDTAFTGRAYESLGEVMAAMHDQASRWELPAGFTRHAFDADGFTGDGPFWGRFWESHFLTDAEKAWFAAIRERVDEILRRLSRTREDFSLIHADLHANNIIMHDEHLHVIDFDDSGFGFHAYDLAVCTGDDDAALASLVEGYRRVRPMSDEVLAQVPFFRLVRQLASIGWLTDRPEVMSSRPDSLIGAISKCAEDVLRSSSV